MRRRRKIKWDDVVPLLKENITRYQISKRIGGPQQWIYDELDRVGIQWMGEGDRILGIGSYVFPNGWKETLRNEGYTLNGTNTLPIESQTAAIASPVDTRTVTTPASEPPPPYDPIPQPVVDVKDTNGHEEIIAPQDEEDEDMAERTAAQVEELFEKELKHLQSQFGRDLSDVRKDTSLEMAKLQESMRMLSESVNKVGESMQRLTTSSENGNSNLDKRVSALDSRLQPLTSRLDEMATRGDLETRFGSIEAELKGKPGTDEVRTMVMDCISNPNSSACELLAKRLKEEDKEEEEEAQQGETEKQEHQSALDYLRCPECRDKFVQASSRVPEFTSAIIDQLGDRDVETLIANLQKQGYQVRKSGSFF